MVKYQYIIWAMYIFNKQWSPVEWNQMYLHTITLGTHKNIMRLNGLATETKSDSVDFLCRILPLCSRMYTWETNRLFELWEFEFSWVKWSCTRVVESNVMPSAGSIPLCIWLLVRVRNTSSNGITFGLQFIIQWLGYLDYFSLANQGLPIPALLML